MDVQSIAMGFGMGGVGGAMLANLMHLDHLSTPLFFLGGIIGAVVCGAEGINPIDELFGNL